MKSSTKLLVQNTVMLYILNASKLILPLLTIPYLTRVLSKDCFGTVAYVKALMQYMQIIVDYGFILSSTKDIVNNRDNTKEVSKILGNTILAKMLLSAAAFICLIAITINVPLLKDNFIYTTLSFIVVFLSCFLMDFLFRGLEEMHVITIRFLLMRGIAVLLTFLFVKNDSDMMYIPILDIIGSFAAIVLVYFEIRKRELTIIYTKFQDVISILKVSSVYFFSNMATTTFTALNTLLIGVYLDAEHVAEWSLCLQMVSAVIAMYTPLTDGIYPYMVKNKNWNLIRKAFKLYFPLILLGSIFTYFVAENALVIVGGKKYASATSLLRAFIPLLIFSFPSILLGWPALGAIGRIKETTKTTLYTALMQTGGIIILILFGFFSVINLAFLRGFTEASMFAMRYYYCHKYRKEFTI